MGDGFDGSGSLWVPGVRRWGWVAVDGSYQDTTQVVGVAGDGSQGMGRRGEWSRLPSS